MAAPRNVHSDVIQNNSDGNVNVRILYRTPVPDEEGVDQEISKVDITMGETYRADERIVNYGSFIYRMC